MVLSTLKGQYDAAEPWGGQGETLESERDERNEEEGGASIGGASSSGAVRQAERRSFEEGKSAEGNDGPSDGEGMRDEELEETGGSGGRSSVSSKPGKQSGGGVDTARTGAPRAKKREGRHVLNTG